MLQCVVTMVRGAPVSSTVANGTSVADCLDMSLGIYIFLELDFAFWYKL